jgi:hypothetical protein
MASKRPIQRDSILADKFHATSIAFERKFSEHLSNEGSQFSCTASFVWQVNLMRAPTERRQMD